MIESLAPYIPQILTFAASVIAVIVGFVQFSKKSRNDITAEINESQRDIRDYLSKELEKVRSEYRQAAFDWKRERETYESTVMQLRGEVHKLTLHVFDLEQKLKKYEPDETHTDI